VQQAISGEIKALMIYGVNLPETMTLGRETAIEALRKVDFMVAVDVLPAEVTGYADVVLPECTYLERYDALDAGRNFRTPFVALRQPAVPPMYESKPGNQIAKMITDKWGMHGVFPASVEAGLDKTLKMTGSSLEEIKNGSHRPAGNRPLPQARRSAQPENAERQNRACIIAPEGGRL